MIFFRMFLDTVKSLVLRRRRAAFIDDEGFSVYWVDVDLEPLDGPVPAWPYDTTSVADMRAAGFWIVNTNTGEHLRPTAWGAP